MIHKKIIQAKQDYYSRHQRQPKFVSMNYDTALMALSRETGGDMVCYSLLGGEKIHDMQLIISNNLKNMELLVGGDELLDSKNNP